GGGEVLGAAHEAASRGAPRGEIERPVSFDRERRRRVADAERSRGRRQRGAGVRQDVTRDGDSKAVAEADGGSRVEGHGVDERAVVAVRDETGAEGPGSERLVGPKPADGSAARAVVAERQGEPPPDVAP